MSWTTQKYRIVDVQKYRNVQKTKPNRFCIWKNYVNSFNNFFIAYVDGERLASTCSHESVSRNLLRYSYLLYSFCQYKYTPCVTHAHITLITCYLSFIRKNIYFQLYNYNCTNIEIIL